MIARDRTRKRTSALLAGGLVCVLAAGGCGREEADRSARGPSVAPRAPAPLPDPGATGISDLARVSRYVFREMARRGGECRVSTPPPQDIEYTVEVTVADGNVAEARLVAARPAGAGSGLPLPPEQWPPQLGQLVACMRPYLVTMEMAQPPADGVYETRFMAPRGAGRELARDRLPGVEDAPAAQTLPDPTEPNLPDLVRLARYAFRVIRTTQGLCSFQNPLTDQLAYTLEIEVKGGRVTRSALVGARVEHPAAPLPLPEASWPQALVDYVACLGPHLEATSMMPAPADGVYRPEYVAQGSP